MMSRARLRAARFALSIRRFRALPRFTRFWFTPAWLLLGVSRALILLLSFRRLARCLGSLNRDGAVIPVLEGRQETRAAQLKDLLQLVSRHTPWTSNCLPQALTARVLLGLHRIPFALCFGVQRDVLNDVTSAHAWVVAGRVAVSGGNGFDQYAVVACFVATDMQPSQRQGAGGTGHQNYCDARFNTAEFRSSSAITR
jgi:hypothetical protein